MLEEITGKNKILAPFFSHKNFQRYAHKPSRHSEIMRKIGKPVKQVIRPALGPTFTPNLLGVLCGSEIRSCNRNVLAPL